MGEQIAQLPVPGSGCLAGRTRLGARSPPLPESVVASEADTRLEELELKLLLEAVFSLAGYDFRSYIAPMLRRRVWQCVREEHLRTISGFQERVLHNPDCLGRFIQALCINVTSLFRRPEFYQAMRREVFSRLHTYPFIRIWHAGCATGEEVFSTAILLHEDGLYERSRIYATDINASALAQARAGILPAEGLEAAGVRYQRAGGRRCLSEYYTATENGVIFDPALRRNILFAQHNLATDSSFNEFNLILCRNVMIYFNRELRERVHGLLHRSLAMFGALGLGADESLRFSPYEHAYDELDNEQKLYRRIA
jgi:chemotaxis protein methyltransferase CheR